MKDDRVYLLHLVECFRRLEVVTAPGKSEFLASHVRQDALLRNLQTLTEATSRLSEALKARHPSIQWRAVASFRNFIVHDYLGIDLEQVWSIVENDLPELKRMVSLELGAVKAEE